MSTHTREARGSLVPVWVCDACGDEIDAHKDEAKGWFMIRLGTWRAEQRRNACGPFCAWQLLGMLRSELAAEYEIDEDACDDWAYAPMRPVRDVPVQGALL